MRKWVAIFIALTVLMVFSFACTGSGKEGYIKCAKCGSYFKTKEGADWFENLGRQ